MLQRQIKISLPPDLRTRLETARLELLALFRSLDQLPQFQKKFRSLLPPRVQRDLPPLELKVRHSLDPREAYSMVPGRDPTA